MQEKTLNLSLSKALKVKSRLAGQLVKVTENISTYNCSYEGRKNEVDVRKLDKERSLLVESLVELKTAIYIANLGIYRYLNEMAEKKSEIVFLNALNTKHGAEPGYNGTSIIYISIIQKQEVNDRVKKLEKEIDDLQDKVDAYNAEPGKVKISSNFLQ